MTRIHFVEVRHGGTWRLDLQTPDRVLAHARARTLESIGAETRIVVLEGSQQFVEEIAPRELAAHR